MSSGVYGGGKLLIGLDDTSIWRLYFVLKFRFDCQTSDSRMSEWGLQRTNLLIRFQLIHRRWGRRPRLRSRIQLVQGWLCGRRCAESRHTESRLQRSGPGRSDGRRLQYAEREEEVPHRLELHKRAKKRCGDRKFHEGWNEWVSGAHLTVIDDFNF